MPPLEALDNFLVHLQDPRLALTSLPGITFTEPFRRPRAEVHGFRHRFPTMNSKYVPFLNARPRNPESGYVPSSHADACG